MILGSVMAAVSVWIRLLVQIAAGILVYVFLAWAFKMESFRYLLRLVKERKHS